MGNDVVLFQHFISASRRPLFRCGWSNVTISQELIRAMDLAS